MDAQLRKEFRDWKPEIEDQLATLKKQVAELMAAQTTTAPQVSGKKSASDAVQTEKDSI